MMAGFQKHAHLTKGAKEQLDLMKYAKEILDMSIRAGKMALGDAVDLPEGAEPVKRDLRSLGSCLAPACKMLELEYEHTIAAKLQEEIDALKEANAKDR
jgi:hypothetical protein